MMHVKISNFHAKYVRINFHQSLACRHMRSSCSVKKYNDAKNEAILVRLVQIEEDNDKIKSQTKKVIKATKNIS